MTELCQQTSESLVDYVDGALPPDQARQVADHLGACPECRGLARALERSLAATRIVWQETLDEASAVSPAARVMPRPWARCAAIAAALVITAGGAVFWLAQPRHAERDATLAQVQERIADCGRAAQLLAAADILARCEGTEDLVKEQRLYILRQYPQTPAAISLANQEPALKGAVQND
jgi:anti-sigma factor RsiW